MRPKIEEVIRKKILLLDGAMGTMIQTYGLQEADYRGERFKDWEKELHGVGDLLSLSRPDVILDIHKRYLRAGADLIETNTFNAQKVSLAEYGLTSIVRELNLASCRLARQAADEQTSLTPEKPRYVIGSLGPTGKSLSMSPDVNDPAVRSIEFDELQQAYEEQIHAMIEGEVDALLCETIFDTLNAKAFLVAAEKVFAQVGQRKPLMLSCTVADKAGRLLSGQTLEAFLTSIEHAPLLSVGLNCGFGPAQMMPFVEEMAQKARCAVSVYPNAGLPNVMGEYDLTPQDMREQVRPMVERSLVNILGGCCGTTDAFIHEYVALTADAKPRPVPQAETCSNELQLAGLERLRINKESNFINVGERLNVAGSRKFLRLIKERNYDEVLRIARSQVEAGAQVLDINMDDGMLDAAAEMSHFLRLAQSDPDIARVPIMIDSSKWEVIRVGLRAIQGKCIVNSISLKQGEEEFLSHARELKLFGAAAVVMAFDEEGQATSFERKIEVCTRAYRLLTEKAGWDPQNIVFDPNILTIGTGMAEHARYALDFIEAAGWIRQNLKGSHVSGGVSNLSFAFRGNNFLRSAIHAAFLYHAIKQGMDMGIVNPNENLQYEDLSTEQRDLLEDLIFNRRDDATERVLNYEWTGSSQNADSSPHGGDSSLSVTDKIKDALRRGITQGLEDLLEQSLAEQGSAGAVIQGPLMAGMAWVGELFGEGKMFLPQVVKTARTMNRAVEILKPYLESESKAQEGGRHRAKVLLATVRGDVHDIGKNIVGVVMACNGFEIIDLGVMTPAELILQKAKEEQVDIIGLSGLITPSLEEMIAVVRLLRENGVDVPVLIGGATTSEMHTALKIAPVYGAPVVWVRDAAQNSVVVEKLLNRETRDRFVDDLQKRQAELRRGYHESTQALSLDEARRNKPVFKE